MKRVAINKITICGFGLIGGCIALDLLKGKHKFDIYAYDRPKVLKNLKKASSFKIKIEPSFRKAIHNSDIIILSTPHKVIESLLARLSKVSDLKNCLVIDTGAVKTPIAHLAKSFKFSMGTQFLPTHPMAGKEKSGFENADSNLFNNHAWYLDEDVKLNDHNQNKLNWMIKKMKAMPIYISSSVHDQIISELSHLPQLISTILGAQINPQLIPLAGPGLRSMLRLAGSPYSVWSEIIDENRLEIIKTLNLYINNLNKVMKMIKNKKSLDEIFIAASRSYKCLL